MQQHLYLISVSTWIRQENQKPYIGPWHLSPGYFLEWHHWMRPSPRADVARHADCDPQRSVIANVKVEIPEEPAWIGLHKIYM